MDILLLTGQSLAIAGLFIVILRLVCILVFFTVPTLFIQLSDNGSLAGVFTVKTLCSLANLGEKEDNQGVSWHSNFSSVLKKRIPFTFLYVVLFMSLCSSYILTIHPVLLGLVAILILSMWNALYKRARIGKSFTNIWVTKLQLGIYPTRRLQVEGMLLYLSTFAIAMYSMLLWIA